MRFGTWIARCIVAALVCVAGLNVAAAQALGSWNDTASKKAITDFVARISREGSIDYVKPAERIAVFDNDGTLWAEQPMNFQLAFAIDRIKTLAPMNPQWQTTQPFKSAIEGDLQGLKKSGEHGLVQIMAASQVGMNTEAFDTIVGAWLVTAQHPKFQRRYTQLVYQPMLELLLYLRQNRFKTFIVSGGGVEFMRVFAEQVYGIPPEQVIGSSSATKFQIGADGKSVLVKQEQVEFIDGPGKPESINRVIGRRPILAFGNSDGDLQMLQWTAGGSGVRFAGIVHHTDAEREYAYDRQSEIGHLDKALDEAKARGWTVVDMKQDWRRVFPIAE